MPPRTSCGIPGAFISSEPTWSRRRAPPEDLETSDRYVAVPSKQELDLGKRVALAFAETHVPEEYERIRSIFSRPGSYARFKDLLEAGGHLTAWYEFEHNAQREALSDWCATQGFEPV